MKWWGVISAGLLAVVAVVAPHQLALVVYKLALVTLACVAGYYIDRALFPYARPHMFLDEGPAHPHAGPAMLRRAIIIAAVVVGVTMGL